MPSALVMIDALRIKVYELFLWPKNKCTLGKLNSEGSDEKHLMYLILSHHCLLLCLAGRSDFLVSRHLSHLLITFANTLDTD